MAETRIIYRVTDVDAPQRERARAVGPEGAPWSLFVLNGHARRFETRGEGSFSIKWMAEGRARYAVNRRPRTVSRDEILLVDHGQPYDMEFETRSGAQSFCLFFSAGLVREAWASREAGFDNADGPGELRPFPNRLFRPSARLGAILHSLAKDGPDAEGTVLEGRLLAALDEAIGAAHRHRGLAGRVPAARPATRAHLLASLERARDRILEAGGVGIDLAALARDAGLSKFHLLRLFKAVYGATPMAFAEQARLERAAAALRGSSRPVTEVAAEAGYDSPSAFAKAFRRRMGLAPSAWRT
jgi:AraC family transcriptional regulator